MTTSIPWTIFQWKPCTYPGVLPERYLISSTGVVWSLYFNRELHPYMINSGYMAVHLLSESKTDLKILLHRLVAYEFCNPPYNYMDLEVNHIDGNKLNNFDSNLEWITKSDNMNHAIVNRLSVNVNETHYAAILTNEQVHIICKYLEQGMLYRDILRIIGLPFNKNNSELISNIKRGIAWKNISSQYNISNHIKGRFTKEQIYKICEMIDSGSTLSQIYEYLYEKSYNDATKSEIESLYEFVRRLKKDEFPTYRNITKDFKFIKFNDYPEIDRA